MIDLKEHLPQHEQLQRDALHSAIRDIMSSDAGKRFLFWLLEQCSPYPDPFCGENTNSTHYTIGQQVIGRRIIAKLEEVDPRLYPQLLIAMAEIRELDKAAGKALAAKLNGEDDAD